MSRRLPIGVATRCSPAASRGGSIGCPARTYDLLRSWVRPLVGFSGMGQCTGRPGWRHRRGMRPKRREKPTFILSIWLTYRPHYACLPTWTGIAFAFSAVEDIVHDSGLAGPDALPAAARPAAKFTLAA